MNVFYSPLTIRVIKILRDEVFTELYGATSHKRVNVWNFKCHANNVFGKLIFLCATPLFCLYPTFHCSKYLLLNISFIICVKKYKKIIFLCSWSNIGAVTYLSVTAMGLVQNNQIYYEIYSYILASTYACHMNSVCKCCEFSFSIKLIKCN